MKIEIIAGYRLVKVLPTLRWTDFPYAINAFARVVISRLAIMFLLAEELCRRLVFGKKVLELL